MLIDPPDDWPVLKRQLAACLVFGVVSALIVAGLYFQDRRREWSLRAAEAQHRLDMAFELISREIDRVRADSLFLADQSVVRQFVSGASERRSDIEREYENLLRRKKIYDQIRLLDLNGVETVRVNYAEQDSTPVEVGELQDKSDRYYFQRARELLVGEVFVSEFDLNLEHGSIEQPLKPVIRFVTPVCDEHGEIKSYLVLNYLGARLLRELHDPTLPGYTLLVRNDGQYLRAVQRDDEWGWLLNHNRSFSSQFPNEWKTVGRFPHCFLTDRGAFASRRVRLGGAQMSSADDSRGSSSGSIIVVSYLPRGNVFASSRNLLQRLLLLVVSIFIPFVILAKYWAQATTSRAAQSRRIAESEERLRDLSSRLLRIQEEERRAISREIHDDLGQQVTAINLDLKLANRSLGTADARAHLERAIQENAGLLESLHNIAKQVRPAVLDDLGLRDAIESHLQEFRARTNIEVDEQLDFQSAEIPDEVADNAYRLLQESLNNIAKHADASTVVVRVSIDKTSPDRIMHMKIHDDGCGFESAATAIDDVGSPTGSRLGLIGMHERVDLLGGKIAMSSANDSGTRIEIELPLGDQSSNRK